jgi:hypothetical protein
MVVCKKQTKFGGIAAISRGGGQTSSVLGVGIREVLSKQAIEWIDSMQAERAGRMAGTGWRYFKN